MHPPPGTHEVIRRGVPGSPRVPEAVHLVRQTYRYRQVQRPDRRSELSDVVVADTASDGGHRGFERLPRHDGQGAHTPGVPDPQGVERFAPRREVQQHVRLLAHLRREGFDRTHRRRGTLDGDAEILPRRAEQGPDIERHRRLRGRLGGRLRSLRWGLRTLPLHHRVHLVRSASDEADKKAQNQRRPNTRPETRMGGRHRTRPDTGSHRSRPVGGWSSTRPMVNA